MKPNTHRRIGWGQGPTEEEAEQADLRGTETVVAPYDFNTPAVADVLQAETGLPDNPIPVEVQGSVRTNELPSETGGIFTRTVAISPNVPLLKADKRRKCATVMPIGGDIRLGSTQNEAATDGAGGVWPNGVPLLYASGSELWAAGIGASRPVTVIVENWAG